MTSDAVRDKIRLGFLTTLQTSEGSFVGGLLVTNHLGRPLEFQCTTPVKPNATQQILYGPTLKPFLLGELIGKTLVEKSAMTPDIILTEQVEVLELRQHVRFPVALISIAERAKKSTAQSVQQPAAHQPENSIDTDGTLAVSQDAPSSENMSASEKMSLMGEMSTQTSHEETIMDADAFRHIADSIASATSSAQSSESTVPEKRVRLGKQWLRFHGSHDDDRAQVAESAKMIPADADLLEPFERVREALMEASRNGAGR
ncbi:MAG: hypothetical protein ACKVT0_23980 [Planctomycetaceae bacterium]